MVPVIRNVENMNYTDIEKSIAELGEKVRKVDLPFLYGHKKLHDVND